MDNLYIFTHRGLSIRYDDMHNDDPEEEEGYHTVGGPELVGLSEEKHLGEGDGVPLSQHS